MKKIKGLKKAEDSKEENKNTSDNWLFLPEGIISILIILAFPVQAVILFMHDRVASGIFLMACAAISIYTFFKLLESKKLNLAFCVFYVYTAISVLIGMS